MVGACLLLMQTSPAQVMALAISPALLDNPHVGDVFPPDAIARAKQVAPLLKAFNMRSCSCSNHC